jgi:DNA ligase 1
MRAFTQLYSRLDETTKTNEKVEALVDYFRQATPADAAWAIYFLSGRKPKNLLGTKKLREWALEQVDIPQWLFEESYDAVGDLAETIALLLPGTTAASTRPLHEWIEQDLLKLRDLDDAGQKARIVHAWSAMDERQRFVWNKLITGSFRVGVSQQLVTRALGKVSNIDPGVIAHRLMGEWTATPSFYQQLLGGDTTDADTSKPYPFCLAHPLEQEPASLGPIEQWAAEWKWDGIRAQLIRRLGRTFLWSRGEELVTERYPELKHLGDYLPDGTVIDGEILPWKDGQVLPFAQLQRRIGRKTIGKKLLEEIPVMLMAYDLLELADEDLRNQSFADRRHQLAQLTQQLDWPERLQLSPAVVAESWESLALQRSLSRSQAVEGLMLKRKSSIYRVGRVTGDWWKWKVQPFTIDAVLIYAQRGHGKRASLYTDYTFGVWHEGQLVTFAKAYSGLTDAEIKEVDAFIRKNTLESFGPVRTVNPELVFELAFEGIQLSNRHKAGIAVRFPRILRWRTDKKPADADTLEQIRRMIPKVE